MRLEELRIMVKKDLTIDPTELDIASLLIPQIHGKYLNFLMDEKMILKKIKFEISSLDKLKWEYYSGKMSQEKLLELGWAQFNLKILRHDIDRYLDGDTELIQLRTKLTFCEERVEFITGVIKAIANLNWNIRNAIDWKKFTQGV